MYLGDKGLDSLYKKLRGDRKGRSGGTSAAEGSAEAKVDDVTVNGASVVEDKVAKIDLSGYALDSGLVHTTGDESISGEKTITNKAHALSGLTIGEGTDKGDLSATGTKLRLSEGGSTSEEQVAIELTRAGTSSALRLGYKFEGASAGEGGFVVTINRTSNGASVYKGSTILPTGGAVFEALHDYTLAPVNTQATYTLKENKNHLVTSYLPSITLSLPNTTTEGATLSARIATAGGWTLISPATSSAVISGTGPAVLQAFADGANWYINKTDYTIV